MAADTSNAHLQQLLGDVDDSARPLRHLIIELLERRAAPAEGLLQAVRATLAAWAKQLEDRPSTVGPHIAAELRTRLAAVGAPIDQASTAPGDPLARQLRRALASLGYLLQHIDGHALTKEIAEDIVAGRRDLMGGPL